MLSVLILGGRAPVALDHARRFQRQGWTVHVADSANCRLSGWSGSVTSFSRIASPRNAPAAFAADLTKLAVEKKIDLIIPTCEEVFYLSRYRASVPSGIRVLAADFETLRQLHSKWQFLDVARDCGVDVPQSVRVTSAEQARDWANGAPLVLKPEFSRFGVHVRLYPNGMPKQLPELSPAGTWVAQRYLAGKELCSYSIANQGRLLAHVVYRPRYRLKQSSSFYFERCESEVIRSFVAALTEKLAFTGQISFDWIEGADGGMTVIECNPRAISGLHLFSPNDDLPRALMGELTSCVEPSLRRPAMIASVMLTAGLKMAIAHATTRLWWSDYRRADDVITARGDYRPLVGGLADLGSFARLALLQGCNLREAATRDIEWDGEELASL